MADNRFFHRSGPFELAAIAKYVGGALAEPATARLSIRDIGSLERAEEGDLSIFSDRRYVRSLSKTHASAVVTSAALAQYVPPGQQMVLVERPRLAFILIGDLFYPAPMPSLSRIDDSALIDASANIGALSQIDAGAVIGAGAQIGARCRIGANAVLGPGVVLGDECRVGPNASISHALIGSRVEIGASVSIGGMGFGYEPYKEGLLRSLQLGRVVIEDDVDIGANSAIDRGTTGDTVIGVGCKLDNLVQIGHNVRLGRFCVVCGQAGIAGSVTIGDGVMIGGQSAISDHITIGAGARIAGKSGVMRDVEPGASVGGLPAVSIRDWHRQTAGLRRLFARLPATSHK